MAKHCSLAVAIIDSSQKDVDDNAGMILGLPPANERRRYFAKMTLIGWAQT